MAGANILCLKRLAGEALCLVVAPSLLLGCHQRALVNRGTEESAELELAKRRTPAPTPAPVPLQVWVLAGQSNATGLGYAALEPNPASLQVPQSWLWPWEGFNTLTHDLTDWQKPLAPVAGDPESSFVSQPYFGVEIPFAKKLSSLGMRVAFVKVTQLGSSLAVDWKPTGDAAAQGPLLQKFRTVLSSAMAQLNAQKQAWKWGGVIWIQGESDSMNSQWSKDYKANLSALSDAFRKEMGGAELPFIISRLNRRLVIPESTVPLMSSVRAAQDDVSQSKPVHSAIDTDDIPLGADAVHYDNSGLKTLGERFAECALSKSSVDSLQRGAGCEPSQYVSGCYIQLTGCIKASQDTLVWTAEKVWFRDPEDYVPQNTTREGCLSRSHEYLAYCSPSGEKSLQVKVRFNDEGGSGETVDSRQNYPLIPGCHVRLAQCPRAESDRLDWTVVNNWFRDPDSNWKEREDLQSLDEKQRCLTRKGEYITYCGGGTAPVVEVVHVSETGVASPAK